MKDLALTTRSAPRLTICSSKSASAKAVHFVRAYRQSPENVYLQIRWKGRFVGVSLTFDEARQLGAHLISEAEGR